MFLPGLLRGLISAYIVLLVIYAVSSWFRPRYTGGPRQPWERVAEWPLQPIRAVLRPVTEKTGLDFSPAVMIVILLALRNFL